MIEKAVKILEKGNLPEAEKILLDLLNSSKEDSEIYYLLSRICFKRDQFEHAIDYIKKSISLKEDDYRYHELLGQCYAFRAQQSGAIKGAMLVPKAKNELNKTLELNNSSLKAKETLFLIYMLSPAIAGGDEEKGKTLLSEIEQVNKSHANFLKAVIALKDKKNDQAEKLLDQAVLEPKIDPEILKRSAQFFSELNKSEKAIKILDKYFGLIPEDPTAFFLLANCYNKLGNSDKEKETYKKIKEIFPGSLAEKQADKMIKQ